MPLDQFVNLMVDSDLIFHPKTKLTVTACFLRQSYINKQTSSDTCWNRLENTAGNLLLHNSKLLLSNLYNNNAFQRVEFTNYSVYRVTEI